MTEHNQTGQSQTGQSQTGQSQTGQSPVDEHTLYLLNSCIDGEITAEEQQELDRLLNKSPEVRKLNDELRKVTRVLDNVPELDPPEYLQDAIERQVRMPAKVPADSKDQGSLRHGWLNANWLRTGFALAAGVVLTFGVYQMGSEPITTEGSTSMTGTIAKKGPVDQPGTLLDSILLNTTGLTGQVELSKKENMFELDLQLSSAKPTEVLIDFAGRGLEFDSVSGKQTHDDSVSIEDGSIRLASMGDQQFTIFFRPVGKMQRNTPLDVNIQVNNESLLRAKLIISGD